MKTLKKYSHNFKLTKVKEENPFHSIKVTCSGDADQYLRDLFNDQLGIAEHFFLLLLNHANNITGWVQISHGGTGGTVVDIKIIAKYAIESLSKSVIFAHNHPSGNTKPSEEDKKLTERAKHALKLLDITLLDHLIITEENGYYSFADEGVL